MVFWDLGFSEYSLQLTHEFFRRYEIVVYLEAVELDPSNFLRFLDVDSARLFINHMLGSF